MEAHHQESIDIYLNKIKNDPDILAVLLGGSIAHGFAKADSDIDLVIVVNDEEYLKRKNEKRLAYSLWDICTYPGGYIDIKIINMDFLEKVSAKGSDPARYAFKDNIILLSKIKNLNKILENIVKFPDEDKESRRYRFAAQLLAWKWFYSEGVKKGNNYLIFLALHKIILFSSRIILNENSMLYPFHKWLLNEIKKASYKPADFDNLLSGIMQEHNLELVNQFCQVMLDYLKLEEKSLDWPNHFLKDSEQNWLEHEPPVDDL